MYKNLLTLLIKVFTINLLTLLMKILIYKKRFTFTLKTALKRFLVSVTLLLKLTIVNFNNLLVL